MMPQSPGLESPASMFAYARISARAVREALMNEKGYEEAEAPKRQTIGSRLNRMGYR